MERIWTKDIKSKYYQDGLKIRIKVFVDEQKVPLEEESDEYEKDCYHLNLYKDNAAVATGRILPLDSETVKFGRIAVMKEVRGTGLGKVLMNEMEEKTKELGYKKIFLGGQVSAIPFYEKMGYSAYGDVFLDGGIDHRMMKKIMK